MILMTFITWFGHYLLHHYNTYNPIAKLHKITHHSPFSDTLLGKLIEYLIIEFWFFGGGFVLLFIIYYYKKYGIYLLNPYIVLFWTIGVPVIHEVYYHQFEGSEFHKFHHVNADKYYSPDHWDTVFMTKKNNDPIENETALVPTLCVVCAIMILIIDTKYDLIKYFSGHKL